MSEPLRYPVPWDLIARLGPDIARGTRADMGKFYQEIVSRMRPGPVYEGLEHLPESPRFVLAANHYQRRGLWIVHASAAVACALDRRYSSNPSVRWLVTANWPTWRLGGWTIPSPGDLVLPRVAHATGCYAVPFAGSNPAAAARTLRTLVRDLPGLRCSIGVYPEGAHATAGHLQDPLPGLDRLFLLLARRGWPVVPAGISESDRLIVRFGATVSVNELTVGSDAGALVMGRIAELCSAR